MFLNFTKVVFGLIGALIGFNIMSQLIESHSKPNIGNIHIKPAKMWPLNPTGEKLYKEVRILCWILSSPNTFKIKDEHIKRTWGKRCNKLLFMGSPSNDTTYEAVRLNVSEGRENLWLKTKEALKYIHAHHLYEADWFFKADDNTFLVPENLRYLLYQYSSEMPIYFGQIYATEGYMVGGSGYAMSKESLKRFVERGLKQNICNENINNEDAALGVCLKNLNVTSGDSRDAKLRERFFQFQPDVALIPKKPAFNPVESYWHYSYLWYDYKFGQNTCCSDSFVATHQITPPEMYLYEYLVYNVRIFGKQELDEEFPRKITFLEIQKKLNGNVVNNGL